MRSAITILFLFISFASVAQDSLVCKLDVQAGYFTTDANLNIYFINEKNEIVKFNALTKDSITFSNKQLGTPTYIDASNPYKVLVLYPDFRTVVVLDNKFTPISIINSNSNGDKQYQPLAVCREAEGDHFWMYDEFSRTLIQFDELGNPTAASEPFDELIGANPEPFQLFAADQRIYLADKLNGVYIFDIFSSLQSTLDLPGNVWFQIINGNLVYLSDALIHITDLRTGEQNTFPLEIPDALQINMQANTIFYRNPDTISVYRRN